MSRIAFFLLALFSGYLAGMYGTRPLMAFCVMELLLGAAAFLMARVFRHNLKVSFSRRAAVAERGQGISLEVAAHNAGALPAGHFCIILRYGHAGPRGMRGKKKLIGFCGRGEQALSFSFCAPYCGMARVRMERVRSYDYLNIFSSSKKINEELEVAVLPSREVKMQIDLSAYPRPDAPAGERSAAPSGDPDAEVRQLREYKPGDLSRHIHWKQSARTDRLWVREYERQNARSVALCLSFSGGPKVGAGRRERAWDAFYRIVSAFLLGCLAQGASVSVGWEEASGAPAEETVSDEGQWEELMRRLYRLQEEMVAGKRSRGGVTGGAASASGGAAPASGGAARSAAAAGKGSRGDLMPAEGCFSLGLDLRLFYGEELVRAFSARSLRSELSEMSQPLRR